MKVKDSKGVVHTALQDTNGAVIKTKCGLEAHDGWTVTTETAGIPCEACRTQKDQT